jgi:UDP-glucose 4-epimerase
MRILITGGAGFIGTNLIELLKEKKPECELVSIDNYSTGRKENHRQNVEYIEADINNIDWNVVGKIDVIFHLAALARIQPSINNPAITMDANIAGTRNVLEFARKYNILVVYAGSSSTHGGVYKNPYTFSKWVGEELCKLYSLVYDLPTIIVRFYNVYGNYMIEANNPYSTVLQIFNEQYKSGVPLTITGDGEQRRDFTHVRDICSGLMLCMNKKDLRAEIFEFGRGRNFSINEVVDLFGADREYIPTRPGEAMTTLADFTKASNILGYDPIINLEDWITNVKDN